MKPRILLIAASLAVVWACSAPTSEDSAGSLLIYTSVTQDTVDAVVDGFRAANPGVAVEVFRAPTGELAARVAAEQREGGLDADILWLTDPLSIQQYAREGVLRAWAPNDFDAIPAEYRTPTFFGTRILNLVIVAATDVDPSPTDWGDLASTPGIVAIPDPGFAGSAFGALGFFASSPDYGMAFYQALRQAGAVQVNSPGDVVSGVAEGLYAAGMTLDRSVTDAADDGSPVALVWPVSGAIAIFSPIGVVDASSAAAAEPFVDYVLSREGQAAIAGTGWQPIRDDVAWPKMGRQRSVDWEQTFDRQDELLADYRTIFGE